MTEPSTPPSLTTFLLMNGSPPLVVAELLVCSGQLKDQAAIDHVLSLFKKFRDGALAYRAFSLSERRWINMRGDMQESDAYKHDFFAEAIVYLRRAQGLSVAAPLRVSDAFLSAEVKASAWYRATRLPLGPPAGPPPRRP